MNTVDIDWTKHNRLAWIGGSLDGFYIDFLHQEVGYKDKPAEHIERMKMHILMYMLEHPGEYITGPALNQIEEFNSVELSKNISSVRSFIVKALLHSFAEEDAKELATLVIGRKKVNGHMGYCLLTEQAELVQIDASSENAPLNIRVVHADEFDTYHKENEESEEENTSHKEQEELKEEQASRIKYEESKEEKGDTSIGDVGAKAPSYLSANWFQLVLLLNTLIAGALLLKSNDLSINNLFFTIVSGNRFLLASLLAMLGLLPIITGLLIDKRFALKSYAASHPGVNPAELSQDKIQHIVMYEEGRFDISKKHLTFLFMCNMTGALTAVTFACFTATLPGVGDFIVEPSLNTPLIVIFLIGVAVTMLMNYSLQTKEAPARNPRNYILSRVHAFTNVLFLFVTLPLCGGLTFIFFAYRLKHPEITGLDSSFCLTILSLYCYLWFSGCSPLADELNSVSRQNYVSGIPVLSAFVSVYTAMCFDGSFTAYMSFAIIVICTAMWVLYFFNRKSRKAARLTTSFFGYMATAVIMLLIVNHIWG